MSDWTNNLRSYQKADAEWLSSMPLGLRARILANPPGFGKQLALDTHVPTPSGWTTIGLLKEGDQVFDENGKPCRVTKLFAIEEKPKSYEVEFSDGTIVVACAEHLWATRTAERHANQGPNAEALEVVTTEQIRETLKYGKAPHQKNNHSIPCTGPLQTPHAQLPIDPYVLGVWLGDGFAKEAAWCKPDLEIAEYIRGAGYSVKYLRGGDRNNPVFGIGAHTSGVRFSQQLRELKLWGNKHIPVMYLRASIEQRRALLAGLMDTDGTVSKSGHCCFDNTNKQLAESVYDLVCGLGFKAVMYTKEPRITGRPQAKCKLCYRVAFTPTQQVFRLPRKAIRVRETRSTQQRRYIVDVRPTRPVAMRCIEVDSPSHLFLVTRSYIPTHNCRSTLAAHRRRIEEGLTESGCLLVLTTAISRKDWVREVTKYWPGLNVAIIGDYKKKQKRKLKAKKGETEEQLKLRQEVHDADVAAARELGEAAHHQLLIDMLKAPASSPCLLVGSHESAERIHELVFGPDDILLNYTAIDEAHVVKKETSKANKVMRPLIARSEISTLITATPVHNKCEDLHQLLDLCALNKFGSKWAFAKKYFHIHTSDYMGKQYIGELKEKELLAAAIEPFIMCRTQEEAYGELPACIYEMKLVDSGNVPLLSREAIRARGKTGGALDTALRQVAEHKMDAAIEHAIDLDEPVVIYTYERGHARYIWNKLNQKKFNASLATGDSSPETRDKIIEDWKMGATKALVCTMDAVRESATLTRASVMLLVDFDWLPGKMVQVMGRIHPSRQPEDNRRPARYFFFAIDGGPDQVVAERLIEKIVAQEGLITMQSSMKELKGALGFLSKKVEEKPEDVLADLIGRIEAREARLSSVGAIMELNF